MRCSRGMMFLAIGWLALTSAAGAEPEPAEAGAEPPAQAAEEAGAADADAVDPSADNLEPGDPPVIDVDEVRVEGRRLSGRTYRGSDAHTVITREEIEAQHPRALVDILRERAGVDVRSTGGPGKATSLRIRGSNDNQVRVYIDDVYVGSATLGSFNWANLASHDIDRVEVRRGPQTTLYGSDAVGGVVQVYTREAEEGVHGAVWGGFGNRGNRRAGARLSAGLESGVRGAVSVEHTTINGISAVEPEATLFSPMVPSNPEYDPWRNTSTSAHLSIPTGDGRLRLSWRREDAQTELDNFNADTETFDQDSRQRHFAIDWRQPVTEWWTTRVLLTQHDDRTVGRDSNPLFGFNNFDIESKRRQASWTHDVEWGGFGFLGGVDLNHDRAVNLGGGIRESTRRTGIFGQLRYDDERFGVTAGVRKEFNNRSTDEWTYQLGGRLTILEGLDLLANFGTAFRSPTLNELFFTGPFTIPSMDLEPEWSPGGDVGLRWIGNGGDDFGWQVDVRAFHQSYEDLIEFRDVTGFFTFQAVNVERARMSGAEAEIRFDWKNFWVATSYTNLRTRDTEGFRLARRSRHAGRLSLGGAWERFRAEVVIHAVGRSWSSAREVNPVEGYWAADVHLSAQIHEHLTARLSVTNVTKHGYQEVRTFGTLPRIAMFQLEASF